MIAFGHSAVGASIGVISYSALGNQDPVLGLILTGAAGVISHYICDFIPHGHYAKPHQFQKLIPFILIFDVFLSLFLFITLEYLTRGFEINMLYVLFGMGGALLPDVVDSLRKLGFIPKIKIIEIEHKFHEDLHWHGVGENGLLFGVYDLWQLSMIGLAIFLLLK